MNNPTREEFDDLKEEMRKLKEQMTEPIKVTVERRQADLEVRLDNHTALLQELSAQSDRHTRAFITIVDRLNTHTETISALQADVTSIKATQSDHGEMLQGLKQAQERQELLLREILNRLPPQ